MSEKLGVAVTWALYLVLCRFVGPQGFFTILVFLALLSVFAVIAWSCIQLKDPVVPLKSPAPYPAVANSHYSPLLGKTCEGAFEYKEHRAFELPSGAYVEITRECAVCHMLSFEKVGANVS